MVNPPDDGDELDSEEPAPLNIRRAARQLIVAFAILVILCALPSLRHVELPELKMLAATPRGIVWSLRQTDTHEELPLSDPTEEQNALSTATRANHHEYSIQLANAIDAPTSSVSDPTAERAGRVRALVNRFPSSASVYAQILRLECADRMRLHRQAEFEAFMDGKASRYADTDTHPPASHDQLEAFAQDALLGEQLDRDNAYFPMMRALSLFVGHRDDEALSALRAASQKTAWTDYTADGVTANWQMTEYAFGHQTAALGAAFAMTRTFPDLNQALVASRMAVEAAVRDEQEGRAGEGVAVRHALMQCGALMRAHSRSLMGAIVGADMLETALLRPGAEASVTGDVPVLKKTQMRREAYLRYLDRSGRSAEADWARGQFAANDRIRQIIDRGVLACTLDPARPAVQLLGWWGAGCFLLANAVAMILLCAAGIALTRRKNREYTVTSDWQDFMRGPVIVVSAVLILLVALAFQTEWGISLALLRYVILEGGVGGSDADTVPNVIPDPDFFSSASTVQAMQVLLAVVVPLIVLLALSLRAWRRREPLAPPLIRWLVNTGPAVTLAIVVLYVGVTLETSRREARVRQSVLQTIANEGAYAAAQLGDRWPGELSR